MKPKELFSYSGSWFIDGRWVQQVVYYNIPWSKYKADWRFKEIPDRRTKLVPYSLIVQAEIAISNMDEVEKSKIYGHYFCKMTTLKHDFTTSFRKLWKDMYILSYKEFVSTGTMVEWYWKFFL